VLDGDAVRYDGEFFKIPFPYETGVENYPAWELAKKSGAIGEIGAKNEVRAVSVVPAPYQRPHPPVFMATSTSIEFIWHWAQQPTEDVLREMTMLIEEVLPKLDLEGPRRRFEAARANGHAAHAD